MLNLNEDRLANVVETAFNEVGSNTRWQVAITKAWQQLRENPYVSEGEHGLLILSPSNAIYEANGTCQCAAYRRGFPCWHRAAARLVQRYREQSH